MDQTRRKKRYFSRLSSLSHSSNEDEVIEVQEENGTSKRKRGPGRPPHAKPSPDVHGNDSSHVKSSPARELKGARNPGRSLSAPILSFKPVEVETTPASPRKRAPRRVTNPENLRTNTPGNPSTAQDISSSPPLEQFDLKNTLDVTNMPGKRKRNDKDSIQLVPESKQIFKDKVFYYIPDNDIAPLRKSRIRKARTYGATWTKEWPSNATHIIVDKRLTLDDVLKFLKVTNLPATQVLVNDIYPIDCIEYGQILNPSQKQYFVSGYTPDPVFQRPGPPTGESSKETAIPLTDLGSWAYTARETTPPRANNSTQMSSIGEQEPAVNIQSIAQEEVSIDKRSDATTLSPERYDLLDEMIDTAKKTKDLPLDEEDEPRPSSREKLDDSTSSTDEAPKRAKRATKPKTTTSKTPFNLNNYSCMTGGTGITADSNPNERTISILQEMLEYYARTNDEWRPRAYRMAISTLRKEAKRISTYDEAVALKFVGPRLALKIEEIAQTDRLHRLENAKMEPGDEALQLFLKIYGVGPSQATKWVEQGYETLEDLKANVQLTENQKIGIDRYKDLNTRIPRDEVTALGEVVQNSAKTLDSKVEVIIAGSYRRGVANSGDIDCLVTKPGTTTTTELLPILSDMVKNLTDRGFLVAALSVPKSSTGSSWHGCCVLPGVQGALWRRIDFLLVPASEIGAAKLYFTGDDIFNRSIRLLASKKNMRLNQRGLFKDVMRGPKRAKVTDGLLVEAADEKKIFEHLGVPWRPPGERICT